MSAQISENGLLIYSMVDLRIKSVLERILGKCLVKEFYEIYAHKNVLNLVGISAALRKAILDNKIEIIKTINKVDGVLNIKDIQVEC